MADRRLKRYQNWPTLLDGFIREVRHRKFVRGRHDCALFACDCIDVMTGSDIARDFRGQYRSGKKAYALVKEKGHDDLLSLADARVGNRLDSPNKAGRGDMVAVPCREGHALAIVDLTGKYAVTAGKDGLQWYPADQWLAAWKV